MSHLLIAPLLLPLLSAVLLIFLSGRSLLLIRSLSIFATALLLVVAWNMAEKEEFRALVKSSKADAMVVIVTFLLVVFRDLTEGIVVGFALGGLVFIKRMSDAAEVEPAHDDIIPDADLTDRRRVIYRLHGPYFFGAAARLGVVLDRIADYPRAFVVDFSDVPFIDSSGARSFELLAHKVARKGGQLYLIGARPEVRRILIAQGAREPLVRYAPDLDSVDATEAARKALSCIYRFQQAGGMSFGAGHLIDVLRGKETDKVQQYGHQSLSTFGVGADLSENQWRAVLRQLIALGHVVAEGEYNTLALTDSARAVLKGEVQLTLREAAEAPRRSKTSKGAGKPAAPADLTGDALARFADLRAWRAEVAREHNLPAYIVFNDATLADMARIAPQTLGELGQISGVGVKKLQAYGEQILLVLKP